MRADRCGGLKPEKISLPRGREDLKACTFASTRLSGQLASIESLVAPFHKRNFRVAHGDPRRIRSLRVRVDCPIAGVPSFAWWDSSGWIRVPVPGGSVQTGTL